MNKIERNHWNSEKFRFTTRSNARLSGRRWSRCGGSVLRDEWGAGRRLSGAGPQHWGHLTTWRAHHLWCSAPFICPGMANDGKREQCSHHIFSFLSISTWTAQPVLAGRPPSSPGTGAGRWWTRTTRSTGTPSPPSSPSCPATRPRRSWHARLPTTHCRSQLGTRSRSSCQRPHLPLRWLQRQLRQVQAQRAG